MQQSRGLGFGPHFTENYENCPVFILRFFGFRHEKMASPPFVLLNSRLPSWHAGASSTQAGVSLWNTRSAPRVGGRRRACRDLRVEEWSVIEVNLHQRASGLVSCDVLGWAPYQKTKKRRTKSAVRPGMNSEGRCSYDHHVGLVHSQRELCNVFVKALQVELACASDVHAVLDPEAFEKK